MKKFNLKGQKFNRLTVPRVVYRLKNGKKVRLWECLCICGNKINVSASKLISGNTQSCGCLRKEIAVERFTTHGLTKTSEYKSWLELRNRCTNPSNQRYEDYGGRGIKVCGRWLNSFENFLENMGKKSRERLSVERINNNGNYEPDNCKWTTPLEQAANTRNLKWFFAFNEKTGETYEGNNQHELGRQHGLDYRNISACLCGKRNYHKGWQFSFIRKGEGCEE